MSVYVRTFTKFLLIIAFNNGPFLHFKTLLLSEDNKDDISVELLDDVAVDQMRKIKVNHLITFRITLRGCLKRCWKFSLTRSL